MKDGYYMKNWLKIPFNGNQLWKNLGLMTPNSSKGGVHSIEANIAIEAKLADVMQRLEDLETK